MLTLSSKETEAASVSTTHLSPAPQAAAKRPAAAAPLTSEEARQQAEAEGLTLLKADNKAGYFGVYHPSPGQPKPYQAQVRRGGKEVSLGSFATAEEAALCIARSPEGQEAARRAEREAAELAGAAERAALREDAELAEALRHPSLREGAVFAGGFLLGHADQLSSIAMSYIPAGVACAYPH